MDANKVKNSQEKNMITQNTTTNSNFNPDSNFAPCFLYYNTNSDQNPLFATQPTSSTMAHEVKLAIASLSTNGAISAAIVPGIETTSTATKIDSNDILQNGPLVIIRGREGYNLMENINKNLTSFIFVEIHEGEGMWRFSPRNKKLNKFRT